MEDPVRADVIAVRHVSLIDEDPALKTSHDQTINKNPPGSVSGVCEEMNRWMTEQRVGRRAILLVFTATEASTVERSLN